MTTSHAENGTSSAPAVARQRERIELGDGRTMSYCRYGASRSDGPVVVVLDGPGSRGLAAAADPIAAAKGVCLVSPDRPGFGDSEIPATGGIAEWPRDCKALLDALEIGRVGLVTQSGGTPYGLAMAALAPERVSALAMLGAIAPTDDPASVGELGAQVRSGIKLARRAPWLLRLALQPMARGARKDPEKIARKIAADLPPADAAVVEDPRMWRIHVDATAEILARPRAIAREIGLLAHPWGFHLADVRAPVALWSGERDEVHPTSQSKRLASQLDNSEIHVVEDAANFGLFSIYPEALRFVTPAR